MSGPNVVCAGCGKPTSLTKPVCDDCLREAGELPRQFCPLCERSWHGHSDVMPADEFGVHHTRKGGYAGKCTAESEDVS